ncbi:MAG: FkbM family methyltransferase [Desulfobulbaceae bacterium]|nr:FkbM family methyltransferase [Desulfobulbaceae bacterium]
MNELSRQPNDVPSNSGFTFLKSQIRLLYFAYKRSRQVVQAFYWALRGLPPVDDSIITKDWIKKLVNKPNPTIVEIGCNDGDHTLWFLDVFANPRVYCFEPDPRAIARFRKKVVGHSNVRLFEMAVSDHNGDITFHQSGGQRNATLTSTMPEGWDFSGSIREPKNHLEVYPWVTFEQSIKVKTTTLDTWCDEQGVGEIDFIWMDVQGAEIDVFRGATNTFMKTRFLYTEYSNKELYKGQKPLKQLLSQLKQFEVLTRYPQDVLLRNRNLMQKSQSNSGRENSPGN